MSYITIEELHALFLACNQQITTDTRKLTKGGLFFALKGENFDANTFVEQAVDKGCAYAVTDNQVYANGKTILLVEDVLTALQDLAKYHRSRLNLKVIGITGSNGKTTNKELICAVLSKKYNVSATVGNLNNHIGVPLTLLALTTAHEIAIVEMGANHQGEIDMLCHIADPDFGIITNIGKAHLEGFGGLEGIKKGKSELYRYLKPKNGSIFINGDDIVLNELSEGLQKITYGEKIEFDVHGKLIPDSEFVEFKWNQAHQPVDQKPLVKTKMYGHYNFINLLCAACIGNYFKVDELLINIALAEYVPEMNRSQVLKTTHNTLILDAYNANPSSMLLAISNYADQSFQNGFFILGDMLELGEYSKDEHKAILDQLIKLNMKEVLLVGDLFFEFKSDYKSFMFFKTSEEASAYLKTNPIVSKTILIKGSRGIKLEKLVEFL